MSCKIIKRGVVQTLYETIANNLELYLEGSFEDILLDEHMGNVESLSFELSNLSGLIPKSGGQHDAENAYIVYKALNGMTPYLARDERIWVYLTHKPCLEFTRQRWLKPSLGREETISSIQSHFFARGKRGFERSNAISSLWWSSFIASSYQGADLRKTLDAFLAIPDLRNQIIERPTTSNSAAVFSAFMDVICNRKHSQKNAKLLKRRVYREWMKLINRYGGVRIFDALPNEELGQLFEELAVSCEQNQKLFLKP